MGGIYESNLQSYIKYLYRQRKHISAGRIIIAKLEGAVMEKINNTQSGRGYLFRVSASEVCNYDCAFCHPSTNERVEVLRDQDLVRIFKEMNDLFVLKTLHFTGGEPLTRKNLPEIVAQCRSIGGENLDIAMTTNAALLGARLDEIIAAGLNRANISLHALHDDKYRSFVGRDVEVKNVLRTIDTALKKGLSIKVNSVVIRNFNDMDVVEMAKYCFDRNIIPRFLELGIYGPVAQWFSEKDQVAHNEIFEKIDEVFGPFERDYTHRGNGPSKYYRNSQGYVFGILDNQSDTLCRGCDRFRMSANGYIKVCNFEPIDLRKHLENSDDLRKQLLLLGNVLDSRGNDYIGKRLHRNDYNFRWNHPEKNRNEG